ncbi:integrin alpha, partial [Nitrosomonas sp. JL21]|uniref:beta strand repeat-containing protein n=1 Tax=Nitrosomonas sp. JL21 TaxID=153949 RepID=UPI001F03F6EA
MSIPVFNLFSINGSDGFRLDGVSEGDYAGASVSSAGDVNGDGFDDVIIGAPLVNAGADDYGASYVVFGKAGGLDATLPLSALDGSNGFRLDGGHSERSYRGAVSSAGDINGDGFDDVMVRGSGSNFVVFGRASGFDAQIDLTTLDGNNGFRLKGGHFYENVQFVNGAVDVNGDGFDDAIVEAVYVDQDNNAISSSYVVFGHTTGFDAMIDLSNLDDSSGFRLTDTHGGGDLSVTGASDINGDGLDDLLVVTDSTYTIPYGGGGGEVNNYVVFGKTSGFAAAEDPADLDASEGLHLNTDAISISNAGDINGDGLDDLVFFSDPSPFDSTLFNYVVFGKASGIDPNLDLSQLDGSDGFTLKTMPFRERITTPLKAAGDVNGDGFDDLIVGASEATPYDMAFAGSSYIVFGRASGFDAVVDLPNLDSDNGIRLDGVAGDSAAVIGGAGDINQDGFDDVIIGAPGADAGSHNSGASYVLLGSDHFKETPVLMGTHARNELNGTPAMEYFTGKGDNDILSGGGGADAISGNNGDDIIRVPDLDFQSANGGAGSDTLAFTGSDIDLKLADYIDRIGQLNLASRIVDIETIDLTGSGDNTLTLTAQSVLDVSDSSDTLVVKGNAGDRVVGLSEGWIDAGMKNGMHAFTKQGAELLIDTSIGTDPLVIPSVIDLSSLDGQNGFRLDGAASFDRLGSSVSDAGDINGDGFDDVIIGDYEAASNEFLSGSSFVVFGKAAGFDASMSVSSLDGSNGFRLDGVHESGKSGFSVSGAGDVNGDGFDDMIIGAPGPFTNDDTFGSSYVVFGKAAGFDARIDLSSLDGSNGFRLIGESYDQMGRSVSSTGDINGDGFDDLIMNGGYTGAKVVFGRASGFGAEFDTATLDGSNGFRLKNTVYADSVSAAGDMNGDGFDDMIIPGSVVFGQASGFNATVDVTSLDGSNGFRLEGPSSVVSNAGDVNGDGFDDVIIGAKDASENGFSAGTSYVVFGKGSDFDAVLELDSLDGSNGFQLTGSYEGDQLGFSVSGAGDVNGDGFDDVIVSGYSFSQTPDLSYVVFGKASGFDAILNVTTLDGSNGVILKGLAGEHSGRSVSGAGDINGDGFDDLIVGAPGASPKEEGAGASYILFGSSHFGNGGGGELPEIPGTSDDDVLRGTSAAEIFEAGDGNDILIGRGGADVFQGGAGVDQIKVPDLNFASIDGGTGTDILNLDGKDLNLDLANVGDKIQGIETICI